MTFLWEELSVWEDSISKNNIPDPRNLHLLLAVDRYHFRSIRIFSKTSIYSTLNSWTTNLPNFWMDWNSQRMFMTFIRTPLKIQLKSRLYKSYRSLTLRKIRSSIWFVILGKLMLKVWSNFTMISRKARTDRSYWAKFFSKSKNSAKKHLKTKTTIRNKRLANSVHNTLYKEQKKAV